MSMNDEVLMYLAQNGVPAPPVGSYQVVRDGTTGAESIASWNTGELGTEPTSGQLSALSGAVAISQGALTAYGSQIAQGVAITSTGTPALNATYAIDPTSQSQLFQIVAYATNRGEFPNGQTTFPYPDITGTNHTFTVAALTNLLKAVSPIIYSMQTTLESRLQGNDTAWPSQAVTIP
jgi:hypothetical protein